MPPSPRATDLHLAGRRQDASDHVAHLQREPQRALLIEDRRVRIAGGRIGHPVLDLLAGLRIELADVTGQLRGEPDVSVLVGNQPMRPDAVGQSLRRRASFLSGNSLA